MPKTMYNGKEVEYEDATPTWLSLLPLYLEVLKRGDQKGQIAAKNELIRMASAADSWVAYCKDKKSQL